jgi:hypothetical protein
MSRKRLGVNTAQAEPVTVDEEKGIAIDGTLAPEG